MVLNVACKRIITVTKDFLETTSLHGYRFIIERRSLTQMFFWLLICIVGLAFSVYLVAMQWIRFQSSPTTMGIETLSYSTSTIPFPAMSLCTNSIYDENVNILKSKLEEKGFDSYYIERFFRSLPSLVTHSTADESLYPDYIRIMKTLSNDFKFTIESLMEHIMVPCDKLIIDCQWLNNYANCTEIFNVVRSFYGYCCSFNYYEKNTKENETDIRKTVKYVNGAGEYISLKLTLNLSSLFYGNQTSSVKTLIHEWYTFPSQTFEEATVLPGQHLTFQIIPEIVESSSDVRSFKKSQRRCIFDDEMKLNISYEYSYKSCLTECRIREINRLCQCNPYYYPKLNRIKTCNWFDLDCLNDNKKMYYSLKLSDYNKTPRDDELRGLTCDCLARCNTFWYNVRSVASEKSNYNSIPTGTMNISTLEMYFKDFTCTKYLRDVYMTWDGLLAAFGGIFGLCMGASLISIAEILFYFCVKYNCYNIFYNNKEKSTASTVRAFTLSERFIKPGELTFQRKIIPDIIIQ